jgi:hypothetical protein
MCARCDRLERIKSRTITYVGPLEKRSLHEAALPMYKAIKDFLKNGPSPATVNGLLEAATIAEQVTEVQP